MTRKLIALTALRWSVAFVSAWCAANLLLSIVRHHAPHIPQLILIPIGIAEIIAAVLFVLPGKTGRTGGIALLVVYVVAFIVHLLHGNYDVANLIVLAAAVSVILTH